MEKALHKYTVLTTIYKNDKVDWVKESIDSMLNQSIKPDEFLILVDGPIDKDMKLLLKNYEQKNKVIKLVFFEENRGLGLTLRDGIKLSKNELIARMDSDDISVENRCEMQLEKFKEIPNLDIIGGNIAEFIDNVNNVISYRKVPEKDEEIKKFARRRNPFNHPSVMFRKSSVLKAGNYRKCHLCEDYDLWARMIMNNSYCHNTQNNIVYMRTSKEFYKRRGGLKYLKSMISLKKEFYKIGFLTFKDFTITSVCHIIMCIIPNCGRNFMYKRILRKKENNE